MNIFRKEYFLRTFEPQKVVKGYVVSATYKDRTVMLNVQPVEATDLKSLPEGKRATKSITSFGDFPVQTANPEKEQRADRLFYDGEWYECVASNYFEHTPLRHYKSLYSRVPEGNDCLAPPTKKED